MKYLAKAFKAKSIADNTEGFGLADYKKVLDVYIKAVPHVGTNLWDLENNLIQLLELLFEKNPAMYVDLIECVLSSGNSISLARPPEKISNLIKIIGEHKTYELISKYEFRGKESWLFYFYIALPVNLVTGAHVKQLLELYTRSNPGALPYDWDYLTKFESLEPAIINQVANILMDKVKQDISFVTCFGILFNVHSKVGSRLIDLFANDLNLLEDMYLANLKADKFLDFGGEVLFKLVQKNPSCIIKYIDQIFTIHDFPDFYSDASVFAKLWELENSQEVMSLAIDHIYNLEKKNHYSGDFLDAVFGVADEMGTPNEIKPSQAKYLKNLINEKNNDIEFMSYIFALIASFPVGDRIEFISQFVSLNSRIEAFEEIPLEPRHGSWSGSAVPMIQAKINFYEKLLEVFSEVKYLKHKLRIEKLIDHTRLYLKNEKKRDFMGDV